MGFRAAYMTSWCVRSVRSQCQMLYAMPYIYEAVMLCFRVLRLPHTCRQYLQTMPSDNAFGQYLQSTLELKPPPPRTQKAARALLVCADGIRNDGIDLMQTSSNAGNALASSVLHQPAPYGRCAANATSPDAGFYRTRRRNTMSICCL